MPDIEVDTERLAAAVAAAPAGEPVYLVNLLRYREQARYPAGLPDHRQLPACSGREAYFQRYVPAFDEAVTPLGGASVSIAVTVVQRLVGPVDEAWDDIAIVRYPDIETFRALLDDEGYRTNAEPHRLAALADWQLIATTAIPLPGD